MQWAVLGLVLFGLILTYIIFQETRAHHHWRALVAKGDVDAIRMLLEQEVARWKIMRVPKGIPPAIWHGIQTAEVVAVGADAVHLTCSAEGEYSFAGGAPRELTTPLEAAMNVAGKLAERVLYDVPNLRVFAVRVDAYTTFSAPGVPPEQRCILTTVADRETADELEWEALRPSEVIERFQTRYSRLPNGVAEPIDPGPLMEDTVQVTELRRYATVAADEGTD